MRQYRSVEINLISVYFYYYCAVHILTTKGTNCDFNLDDVFICPIGLCIKNSNPLKHICVEHWYNTERDVTPGPIRNVLQEVYG